MANLLSVLSYISNQHPKGYGLSVESLIKIVYLVDWKFAIEHGCQMTNIVWEIRDFEPWMDDRSVNQLIKFLARLRVKNLSKVQPRLSEKEKQIVDFVIKTSTSKVEDELTRLVYSTYPAITQNSSEKIDLSNLAREYKNKVKPLLKTGSKP